MRDPDTYMATVTATPFLKRFRGNVQTAYTYSIPTSFYYEYNHSNKFQTSLKRIKICQKWKNNVIYHSLLSRNLGTVLCTAKKFHMIRFLAVRCRSNHRKIQISFFQKCRYGVRYALQTHVVCCCVRQNTKPSSDPSMKSSTPFPASFWPIQTKGHLKQDIKMNVYPKNKF